MNITKLFAVLSLVMVITIGFSGCISDISYSDTARIGQITVVSDTSVILTIAGRVIWYENITSDNWIPLTDNFAIPLNEDIYIYQYLITKPGGIILWARMQITKPDGTIIWGDYNCDGSHVGEHVVNTGPAFMFQANQTGIYNAVIYLGIAGSFPNMG